MLGGSLAPVGFRRPGKYARDHGGGKRRAILLLLRLEDLPIIEKKIEGVKATNQEKPANVSELVGHIAEGHKERVACALKGLGLRDEWDQWKRSAKVCDVNDAVWTAQRGDTGLEELVALYHEAGGGAKRVRAHAPRASPRVGMRTHLFVASFQVSQIVPGPCLTM